MISNRLNGELRKSSDRPVMCMYSTYEGSLLNFTRHSLTSAQNIRVTFLQSPVRFIQLENDKILVQLKCVSF